MTTHAPRGARRRTVLARVGVATVLAVPALVVLPSGPAQAATSINFTQRASGFEQPVQVTSARDGLSRLFVVEKSGRIRIVKHGRVNGKPFFDIHGRVNPAGEGGLLSVAFHPHYAKHPFFWVAYTNRAGDVQVSRFRARGPHSKTSWESSEKKVIRIPHPVQNTNHFAGQLVFGPGHYLFVSTGDGGGGGDPLNHGQSRKTLQGKVLRLQVLKAHRTCGEWACIPKDNPYAGKKPGKGAIWLIGLRNPWRFSQDPKTGDLWIADVGQEQTEEIDHVTRGGLNLGWSCREGDHVYNASRCRSGATYFPPTYTYDHGYGNCIIGGFIYRGSKYASLLGGRYVGADFGSGKVFYSSGGNLVTAGSLPNVTGFGEDDNRELWAVTIDGGLWQMSAA